MYKYQNVSKNKQTLTETGNINPREVEAGKEVDSDVPIENPNFKYVGAAAEAAPEQAAQINKTETEEIK